MEVLVTAIKSYLLAGVSLKSMKAENKIWPIYLSHAESAVWKTNRSTSEPCLGSRSTSALSLEWQPFAPLGPKAAFHVGGVINNQLYVHGGIRQVGSSEPCNQLFRVDAQTGLWEEIRAEGSPRLSHHAAVVLDNRYLLLIGGWDGRSRVVDLYVYDALENRWSNLHHTGFPKGGGLSSHTASLLSDGTIVVIGREGSLRTQRRHGNAYLLSGNISSGVFMYKECSSDITSRSGHTASAIDNSIFIIGGRSDQILEKAAGFQGKGGEDCTVLSRVLSSVERSYDVALPKFPGGRKNHVAVSNKHCIFVHGGEAFDGRREAIGDMFLVAIKAPVRFFKLNGELLHRGGHVCFALPDKILIHGGVSGKSNIHGDMFELKLKCLS